MSCSEAKQKKHNYHICKLIIKTVPFPMGKGALSYWKGDPFSGGKAAGTSS